MLIVCGLLAPSTAQAADPPALLGINSQRGHIDLAMLAPSGSRVDFFERIDGQAVQIGSGSAGAEVEFASAVALRIATWRCDRLERRFVGVATAPDGRQTIARAETRTPDCRDRLEVVVPRKIARGALLPVTVFDRFTLGGTTATVCAGRQGAKARCKTIALTEAAPEATARFRVGTDAVWRVRVRHAAGRIERILTVGKAKRPAEAAGLPALLVTGDSLTQGIDAFLSDRLQTAFDVTSDTRPGTGLVKPTATDWPALARSQAAKLKPAVTVLSLGINDGVPIAGVECCSPAWSAAYARRARSLMRTYTRGSRGRMLWLTLPLPRDPRFAVISRAVNVGIRQAAAGQESVTLIDLAELLTPGDRYRDAIPIDGQSVRVRAGDGIHLSVAGARYVASVIVTTLQRFRPTG